MKQELDEALCAKYPKLFEDRNKPMTETAMCWGFDCGDGWYNIISTLCGNIQWHIDQREKTIKSVNDFNTMREAMIKGDFTLFDEYEALLHPNYKEKRRKEIMEDEPRKVPEVIHQVTVNQVKEKFGTLRFYYSGGDDYISGLEAMAESMSAVTCEVCGSPGRSRGGGWITTLCDTHAEAKGIYTTEEEDKV